MGLLLLPLLWWLLVRHDLERHVRLLGNTAYLLLQVTLFSLPLGATAAVLIVRTNVFGRRAAAFLLAVMLFIPLYLQAAAWDAGFAKMGWYTLASETLDQPLLSGWLAVIWIHTLVAVPWVALIVGVQLTTIERELDEAALLEGSAVRAFLHTTVPRLMPAMIVAALWVCVTTAAEMTVADLYQVATYAEEVYVLFATEDDRGSILRQTGPGICVVGWLTLALFAAAGLNRDVREPTTELSPLRFRLKHWNMPGTLILAGFVLLVVGIPLLNLIYKAGFVTHRIGQQTSHTWSIGEFAAVVVGGLDEFRPELVTTAILGCVAATSVMMVTLPLGWLARLGGMKALPTVVLGMLAAAIPSPLIGLLVIMLFDRPESEWLAWVYDRTIVPPVIALVVRSLPLGLLLCWLALRSVPQATLDAASVDGASAVRRVFSIAIGQRRNSLMAIWLATFAYASGDLAASILVVPPDMYTVPVRVFGLIHAGVRNDEAALCLISAVGFAAIAAVCFRLIRGRRRSAAE
ncbi:MAG: iron ABC transporter permease [Planctomycetales bacterium]|nr:iron ABC transporter permease [Planctomycetales bacterium]